MAEPDLDPIKIGHSIAHEYLSKHGWARQWRQNLNRQLYPGFQREEFEAKQQECDQMTSLAEDAFSRSVERWRHSVLPQKNEVLQAIVEVLGKRNDLGFFAERIVNRLKRELGPA
ncbi:hypothetical protein ACFL4J_01570 [Candidatus Margulisiibacteriota bacterium]